jgi:cephalosporin hydroxylase
MINTALQHIIDDSVLYRVDPNLLNKFKKTKWNCFKWKGLTLMKDPMTLSIYQQLINDVKPKTIIEFGSYEGGGAAWMDDICQALNLKCKIITIDIDSNNYKYQSPTVEFLNFDANSIRENMHLFKNLQRPIIVIEDCHVNQNGICKEMDNILSSGDYLIIEDTLDKIKHDDLITFLESNNNYDIDRYYCDFWGTNNSWNVNSFLRKL